MKVRLILGMLVKVDLVLLDVGERELDVVDIHLFHPLLHKLPNIIVM